MDGNPGIHVFLASPDALVPPDAAETVARSLDDADRQHIARFRFPRDRTIATASRMLQRLAIARIAGIAPADIHAIRFSASAGNRPTLIQPASARAIQFSAANTEGMVACAVSCSARVGMDIEKLQAELPPGMLEHCCTGDEQKELHRLSDDLQRRSFFQLWTLKEAYLKARGIGLQVSPQLIGFNIAAQGGTPALKADVALEPNPQHWHFRILDAGNAHAASLCVHSEACSPPPVTIWRCSWSGESFAFKRETLDLQEP